jgi:hypothetical protein
VARQDDEGLVIGMVRHGGHGGRNALLERLADAVNAIPASLDLSAPAYLPAQAGET